MKKESMRSKKCKECKRYLGESFRDFPEGTVDDGTDYWCNRECYINASSNEGAKK